MLVAPIDARSPDDEVTLASSGAPHRGVHVDRRGILVKPPGRSNSTVKIDGQHLAANIGAGHDQGSIYAPVDQGSFARFGDQFIGLVSMPVAPRKSVLAARRFMQPSSTGTHFLVWSEATGYREPKPRSCGIRHRFFAGKMPADAWFESVDHHRFEVQEHSVRFPEGV